MRVTSKEAEADEGCKNLAIFTIFTRSRCKNFGARHLSHFTLPNRDFISLYTLLPHFSATTPRRHSVFFPPMHTLANGSFQVFPPSRARKFDPVDVEPLAPPRAFLNTCLIGDN